MADITITFGNTINQSLQVGDIVYFEKEKDIVDVKKTTKSQPEVN